MKKEASWMHCQRGDITKTPTVSISPAAIVKNSKIEISSTGKFHVISYG
jgi:hypothetical protein